MQSTPVFSNGDKWVVEVETEFQTRTHGLLANRTGNDPFNRWGNRAELSFVNAESAVSFCIKTGWEYEVIYQGNRYHKSKSYADNFTFKKEELSDAEEDDIEFSRL